MSKTKVTSKKKFLPKLVIDRKKWGTGSKGGYLLKQNGLMCCLGFACLAAGATKDEILYVGMPEGVNTNADLGWLNWGDTPEKLAEINDNTKEPKLRREKRIAKIFAEKGCKVTFIN